VQESSDVLLRVTADHEDGIVTLQAEQAV